MLQEEIVEHEVSRRIKTQAMQEMDGLLTASEKRVIGIGATPVPLPSAEDRRDIFGRYFSRCTTGEFHGDGYRKRSELY